MDPFLEKIFNHTSQSRTKKESSILLIGTCSGFSDLLAKCNVHSVSGEKQSPLFTSSPIVDCNEISYECFTLYSDIGGIYSKQIHYLLTQAERSQIIHVWQSSCITDQLLRFFVHQSLRLHGLDALWVIYVNYVFSENPKGFAKDLLEVLRSSDINKTEKTIMNEYHNFFSTVGSDEFSPFFNFTIILPQIDDENKTFSMNDDMKDFIQQFIRSLLLLIPMSSLMYLSTNPCSWDNFKSLLNLYLLNDNPISLQENHHTITSNTIDNDRLLIPPCWDTMQKIQNVNLKFCTIVVDLATKNLHQVFETNDLITCYESIFHNQGDSQQIPDNELDFPCKSHQQFLKELRNKLDGFEGHEGAVKQLPGNQNHPNQDRISLSSISENLNVGKNHESNNALSTFFSNILNENIS
ncbi:uncharacterized protein SOCG_00943 [Schizosaccharomyces octosporus yFS286]|uniref:Dynein light intermediate chain n=1 Tax=Schizosaccharomyces octosporus (strain yFS286) TaxID=483514 RepID=S9Q0F2_SCHOY|nr:uncharacterized protein SOCG_00943 [Schizosaccharomyces octosporus yFS286]EPX73188.1 hypothetical protein SOCG_00943 [Schizosaccharomyces octosporus yFS286]